MSSVDSAGLDSESAISRRTLAADVDDGPYSSMYASSAVASTTGDAVRRTADSDVVRGGVSIRSATSRLPAPFTPASKLRSMLPRRPAGSTTASLSRYLPGGRSTATLECKGPGIAGSVSSAVEELNALATTLPCALETT